MLVTPCASDGPSRGMGRVSAKGAAKAAAVPDHPGVGEVAKTPSGRNGSAGLSIQPHGPQEGVDLIEMSFDLSL